MTCADGASEFGELLQSILSDCDYFHVDWVHVGFRADNHTFGNPNISVRFL